MKRSFQNKPPLHLLRGFPLGTCVEMKIASVMADDASLVGEAGRMKKMEVLRRMREVLGRVGEEDDRRILFAMER